MSTNYYWIPGEADARKAFGSIHIGKLSGGWSFHFQGFRFAPAEPVVVEVAPGLNMAVDATQLRMVATSWAEWKALLDGNGHIEDEYGRTVPFDEFAQLVEVDSSPQATWGDKPLLNHVTHVRTDPRYKHQAQFHDEARYWLDSAGYAFGMCDFS